jgi:hypothetical protein
MSLNIEDLGDQNNFRLLLTISYKNLMDFVFEYLKKKSFFIVLFWLACLIFLGIAVFIRINIAGHYPLIRIILHSFIGFVILPIVCIPIHELLHAIPLFLTGAKNIRVGMDLKQYLFYVSAHRYVASPFQFWIVALTPFVTLSAIMICLIIQLPDLWKWTISSFLFAHATMCAGDFALLNLYWINRDKKIYTWDDVDKREAYYYEKLS